MKKLHLTLLFLGTLFCSVAQNSNYNDGVVMYNHIVDKEIKNLLDSGEDYKGSPYGSDTFTSGNVYIGKEVAKENVLLRYNKFSNEIEISSINNLDSENYGVLLRDKDVRALIGQNVYIFFKYLKNNNGDLGCYLKLLNTSEKNDLLVYDYVKYIEGKKAQTPYENDRLAEYRDYKEYYIVSRDGTPTQLPNSKNKIAKLFPAYSKQIKKFFKENKLSLDTDEDYVKFSNFLFSIL